MSKQKKHVQIRDSYKIWRPSVMRQWIYAEASWLHVEPTNYTPYIIEWWLHNIGYWLTRPFIFIPAIKKLNERAKHVDLMVEVADDPTNTRIP